MAATFESVWRKVALQASAVPPLLVRSYVQDAFQEACQGRRWSFLRRETKLTTQASRAVTAVATLGSTALTGGAFVAGDLDRQIRTTNSGVPYTIVAVDPGFTAVTLDQAYRGATGSTDFTILDAFLYMPADFDGCRTLGNLQYQRPMPWWITTEQLDTWDPNRIWGTSLARCIAAKGVWQVGTTYLGRQVYEWWPYPSGGGIYDFSYYATADPADTDLLQGQLALRSHVLEVGALAACALYPGTAEKKNPYFNTALAQTLEKKWQEGLQELSVRDEDTSPAEEFNRTDWRWLWGGLPMDSHGLRSTDASVEDYYGGGGYYY